MPPVILHVPELASALAREADDEKSAEFRHRYDLSVILSLRAFQMSTGTRADQPEAKYLNQ
jgi:DNA-directed RNA polymerase subunit K/omega